MDCIVNQKKEGELAWAVISSLNCSLCVSLIISNSVSCNSLAVSSPFKRLSLGTLQFLMKRLTQLLTRTSDSPSSKHLVTRCHLENLDGCKRQLFSLVVTKVETDESSWSISSPGSRVVGCSTVRRSHLTSFKASEGLDDFLSGHSLSRYNRNFGPFHQSSHSASSETVSPLVP